MVTGTVYITCWLPTYQDHDERNEKYKSHLVPQKPETVFLINAWLVMNMWRNKEQNKMLNISAPFYHESAKKKKFLSSGGLKK